MENKFKERNTLAVINHAETKFNKLYEVWQNLFQLQHASGKQAHFCVFTLILQKPGGEPVKTSRYGNNIVKNKLGFTVSYRIIGNIHV